MKVKNCIKAISVANDVTRKLYDYKKGEIDRLDNRTIAEIIRNNIHCSPFLFFYV